MCIPSTIAKWKWFLTDSLKDHYYSYLVYSSNNWRTEEVRRSAGRIDSLPKPWEGLWGYEVAVSQGRARRMKILLEPWSPVAHQTRHGRRAMVRNFIGLPRFWWRLAKRWAFYINSILRFETIQARRLDFSTLGVKTERIQMDSSETVSITILFRIRNRSG
jgi:hypothetical protein